MPVWEYKIITSGPLGFASPQLLEQHLNQLGKEEWEVVHFQTRPDNPLAFYGLARRPVARDWTMEASPAAGPGLKSGAFPAPPEEKAAPALDTAALRAEAEERRESLLAREESLRPVHDEAEDEDDGAAADDDDQFEEEELPTFFEAIRPHMRRNQKGPGMAASVEYLAQKFGQTEADLVEALKECGFTMPAGPKDPPAYLEYDGDLYWLNFNHRHQLWVNTKEKPRAAFKVVAGVKVEGGPIPEIGERKPERESTPPEVGAESAALSGIPDPKPEMVPAGPALLDRLRPMMRRNRHEPGWSGSLSYLARALKSERGTLEAAFAALGLAMPASAGGRPARVEIGGFTYWLNRDKSGQTWINAREGTAAEAGAAQPELPLAPPPPAPTPQGSPLAAVRLLLKETKRGGVAAETGRLAAQLNKTPEELLAGLTGAGLRVPEKAREKPVFIEHAGEIFWLNRNARGELWLNAKASKFAGQAEEDEAEPGPEAAGKPRRPRKKKDEANGA